MSIKNYLRILENSFQGINLDQHETLCPQLKTRSKTLKKLYPKFSLIPEIFSRNEVSFMELR